MLSANITFAPSSGFHRHGSGTLTPTSLAEPPRARASSHSRPPPPVRLESLLERTTQFERLITGQESEAGEAPPAYDEVVAS